MSKKRTEGECTDSETSNHCLILCTKSFAYVDFASPDSKVIAITMSEQNLDGRRLLIKDGM